jgi:hypothetical protein
MKYISNRERFIKEWKNEVNINEAFDMSGGSGPMGNDINWGDSLVGRMFNSIFRKIGIQQDIRSINNVIKAIQKEFESIKIESQTSGIDGNKLSRLHISFLLEALTNAVHSGTKVSIIKAIAEETIDIVDESELKEEDKIQAIEELEDFLKFLEQYDDEIGEDLSDELTGVDKEEEEKAESLLPTGGWGNNTYAGMTRMFTNLIKVIENKDESITAAQGEKEDIGKSKDVNYIKNEIVKSLKNVYNTPLLEIFVNIKDNSIYFRGEKLATVNEKGQFIGNIGKWDSQNKRFTKDEKPRILEITNEIISAFSSHIAIRLKETLGDKTIDKDVELSENEIKIFNEKVSGKWAYMLSNQGNHYSVKIENIDNSGSFKNTSIWKINKEGNPVEVKTSYGPTKISSLFKRGSIFNKQAECLEKLKEETKKSGGPKEETKKEPESLPKTGLYDGKKVVIVGEEGDKFKVRYEDNTVELVSKNRVKVNESIDYDYLLEKTRLSSEETDANQALKRLKESLNELITTKSKTPAINIEFLESINKKATKDFMFKFASEIKSKYNQVSEKIQEKPLYENIQSIDDTLLTGPREKVQAKGLRDSAAEKIAMFASISMLFVGEGLYGELGELGKHLDKFNNEFQKLLNTEFTQKTTESKRVFSYSDFMSINEKKTQQEISEEIKNYYDENVSYDKWKVTKEEVKSVDDQIRNSKPSAVSYDRIIRIVKLFNKAHKIHTTNLIPSGRKSGKVSNRVFREYEFVGGDGSGGKQVADGGVEPGDGPYRNKKVFNKFEEAILSIIEDRELRDFFSENVTIIDKDKDGKKIETKAPGDGKILMKFITDLLDGNKLYKSGAQSKFFQEYFGFKIDEKEFGGSRGKDGDDNKKTEDKDKLESLSFKRVGEIDNITNSVNAISMTDKFIYFVIIGSDDNNVYIKYTSDFSKIDTNIKNKVDKGDINNISREKSDIFYASIKKDDFPISQTKVSIKVVNAVDVVNDQQSFSVTNNSIKDIKSVYTLKGEKDIFKIKKIFPSEKTNIDVTKDSFDTIIKTKLK